MATKSVPVKVMAPVVTLSIEQGEKLFELYDNLVAADAHYMSCQSANFRNHIKSVCAAQKIADAFAELRQQLNALESEAGE